MTLYHPIAIVEKFDVNYFTGKIGNISKPSAFLLCLDRSNRALIESSDFVFYGNTYGNKSLVVNDKVYIISSDLFKFVEREINRIVGAGKKPPANKFLESKVCKIMTSCAKTTGFIGYISGEVFNDELCAVAVVESSYNVSEIAEFNI
jgi:hypothetical protein